MGHPNGAGAFHREHHCYQLPALSQPPGHGSSASTNLNVSTNAFKLVRSSCRPELW